jgi:hypothetical protein
LAEENSTMRTAVVLAVLATAALAGCTVKSTTVKQADAPPAIVYQQPAPTVVYKAPPAVVYEQAPAVYNAPNRSVAVTYTGRGGFELAAQKADAWCDEHYGASDVQLVRDDQRAGRATFACMQR